jgi:hypothetical protein
LNFGIKFYRFEIRFSGLNLGLSRFEIKFLNFGIKESKLNNELEFLCLKLDF